MQNEIVPFYFEKNIILYFYFREEIYCAKRTKKNDKKRHEPIFILFLLNLIRKRRQVNKGGNISVFFYICRVYTYMCECFF